MEGVAKLHLILQIADSETTRRVYGALVAVHTRVKDEAGETFWLRGMRGLTASHTGRWRLIKSDNSENHGAESRKSTGMATSGYQHSTQAIRSPLESR